MRGLRLAAIAAFAVGALGSVVLTPASQPVFQIQAEEEPPPAAFTVCTQAAGRPQGAIFMRLDVMDKPQAAGIAVHEISHSQVIASFPSCDDYDAWLRRDDNRLKAEALGYCEQSRYEVKAGTYPTLNAAIKAYASILFLGYPELNLTVDSAVASVHRYCPPEGGSVDLIR